MVYCLCPFSLSILPPFLSFCHIYFTRGSCGRVLWWGRLCVCVCVCVCLSVSTSLEASAWSLPIFFCMLPMAVARSSFGSVTKSQGEGQFWGLSGTFKSISNLRCSHRCHIHCRDRASPNNVMQQKGSFGVPGKCELESGKFWVQAMWSIGWEGGDGSAHCKQSLISTIALLWPSSVADADIIFLPCGFFFLSFFSSPNLSGRKLECTILQHMVWPTSVNLECRSETCCPRLTGNAGPKKIAKKSPPGRHHTLCWAISSQLRHVSTIGKKTC